MIKEKKEIYFRECSHCNNGMNEGYIVHDGNYYFCSYECGEKHLGNKRILTTLEDWNNDGPGLTWKEFHKIWEDLDDFSEGWEFALDECSWTEWEE